MNLEVYLRRPRKVLEILGDAKLPNERKSGMLTSGKGLAFGSSVEISTGDLDWWIFYASLDMGAGFDVMLNSGAMCNKVPAGINGWYANGSAYAYFEGDVGLYFQFCKKCKERKIPLVELSVAAQIEMGIPNPFWADGYAAGSASILGIWEGSFDFHVQYGEYCEFTPVYKPKEALSGLVFIQDVLAPGRFGRCCSLQRIRPAGSAPDFLGKRKQSIHHAARG